MLRAVVVLGMVSAAAAAACCGGEENMCACRGFAASSFTPEVVVFESTTGNTAGAFAEGTCGYADAVCDLKWASVCCAVDEEEAAEESSFFDGASSSQDNNEESPEEFCARNRFGDDKKHFEKTRVAYPGKTCEHVVKNAEDLFAQCCCESTSHCCPRAGTTSLARPRAASTPWPATSPVSRET